MGWDQGYGDCERRLPEGYSAALNLNGAIAVMTPVEKAEYADWYLAGYHQCHSPERPMEDYPIYEPPMD